MAIEVFNRHEKKYVITDEQYRALKDKLKDTMELDRFNKDGKLYTVCNIYYDTDDDLLIRKSISKPEYKEKLRVRSYGVPSLDAWAFVEIKKKVSGLVNKRRSAMSLREAYDFLAIGETALTGEMNHQVVSEISYMLSKYKLVPKLYIAYDREAMFAKDGRDLRITFDTNIRTRRDHLRLEYGDIGELLLKSGLWLMEVKAEKSIPYWFTSLLSELKIYPASFSKYGAEYQLSLCRRTKKGATTPCLPPSLKSCLALQQTAVLPLAAHF